MVHYRGSDHSLNRTGFTKQNGRKKSWQHSETNVKRIAKTTPFPFLQKKDTGYSFPWKRSFIGSLVASQSPLFCVYGLSYSSNFFCLCVLLILHSFFFHAPVVSPVHFSRGCTDETLSKSQAAIDWSTTNYGKSSVRRREIVAATKHHLVQARQEERI